MFKNLVKFVDFDVTETYFWARIFFLKLLKKYFPALDDEQVSKFLELPSFYAHWNEQINLISRRDLENFEERHVLHSLSIAKFISFKKNAVVLDLGTGGGFPGIPLAIFFPETEFHLTDSIGKKIKVVEAVARELQLNNVIAKTTRTEAYNIQCDFVVTRAVAKMEELVHWTKGKIKKNSVHEKPNGIIALKGGDLGDELQPYRDKTEVIDLKNYFDEYFFETKKLVYYHA